MNGPVDLGKELAASGAGSNRGTVSPAGRWHLHTGMEKIAIRRPSVALRSQSELA
jgi:hypothetical protein